MKTDKAWEHVHLFRLSVDNLGRIGDLRARLTEMVKSEDWRDYTSALGRQRWGAAEFDYFLIDCGVAHEDARRAIEWSGTGTDIASAMDPKAEPPQRRSIEEAARGWPGVALFKDFLGEARRLGWLADDGAVKLVVSERALSRARTGLTVEAQVQKSHTDLLNDDRRRQLDALTDSLIATLDTGERRYVIDRIRNATHRKWSPRKRPPTLARSDAERLGWSIRALAAHWGVDRATADRWVKELRDAPEA